MAGYRRSWVAWAAIGAAEGKAVGDDFVPLFNGEDVMDVGLAKTSRRDRPLVEYIGFQDHGLPLWFRNIRINALDDDS